ncbi:unnamed protein product [Amoebophrya sp. A25]|nr:unnamed protein product [Amoebophrya sp. A25]|eukprot:GSA25T00014700001.1
MKIRARGETGEELELDASEPQTFCFASSRVVDCRKLRLAFYRLWKATAAGRNLKPGGTGANVTDGGAGAAASTKGAGRGFASVLTTSSNSAATTIGLTGATPLHQQRLLQLRSSARANSNNTSPEKHPRGPGLSISSASSSSTLLEKAHSVGAHTTEAGVYDEDDDDDDNFLDEQPGFLATSRAPSTFLASSSSSSLESASSSGATSTAAAPWRLFLLYDNELLDDDYVGLYIDHLTDPAYALQLSFRISRLPKKTFSSLRQFRSAAFYKPCLGAGNEDDEKDEQQVASAETLSGELAWHQDARTGAECSFHINRGAEALAVLDDFARWRDPAVDPVDKMQELAINIVHYKADNRNRIAAAAGGGSSGSTSGGSAGAGASPSTASGGAVTSSSKASAVRAVNAAIGGKDRSIPPPLSATASSPSKTSTGNGYKSLLSRTEAARSRLFQSMKHKKSSAELLALPEETVDWSGLRWLPTGGGAGRCDATTQQLVLREFCVQNIFDNEDDVDHDAEGKAALSAAAKGAGQETQQQEEQPSSAVHLGSRTTNKDTSSTSRSSSDPKSLLKYLRGNPCLEVLSLEHCGLQAQDIGALAAQLFPIRSSLLEEAEQLGHVPVSLAAAIYCLRENQEKIAPFSDESEAEEEAESAKVVRRVDVLTSSWDSTTASRIISGSTTGSAGALVLDKEVAVTKATKKSDFLLSGGASTPVLPSSSASTASGAEEDSETGGLSSSSSSTFGSTSRPKVRPVVQEIDLFGDEEEPPFVPPWPSTIGGVSCAAREVSSPLKHDLLKKNVGIFISESAEHQGAGEARTSTKEIMPGATQPTEKDAVSSPTKGKGKNGSPKKVATKRGAGVAANKRASASRSPKKSTAAAREPAATNAALVDNGLDETVPSATGDGGKVLTTTTVEDRVSSASKVQQGTCSSSGMIRNDATPSSSSTAVTQADASKAKTAATSSAGTSSSSSGSKSKSGTAASFTSIVSNATRSLLMEEERWRFASLTQETRQMILQAPRPALLQLQHLSLADNPFLFRGEASLRPVARLVESLKSNVSLISLNLRNTGLWFREVKVKGGDGPSTEELNGFSPTRTKSLFGLTSGSTFSEDLVHQQHFPATSVTTGATQSKKWFSNAKKWYAQSDSSNFQQFLRQLSPVAQIAELLARNSVLRVLDLSENAITDEGCSVLSKGLAQNEGLRELALNRARIGSRGAMELFERVIWPREVVFKNSRSATRSLSVMCSGGATEHLQGCATEQVGQERTPSLTPRSSTGTNFLNRSPRGRPALATLVEGGSSSSSANSGADDDSDDFFEFFRASGVEPSKSSRLSSLFKKKKSSPANAATSGAVCSLPQIGGSSPSRPRSSVKPRNDEGSSSGGSLSSGDDGRDRSSSHLSSSVTSERDKKSKKKEKKNKRKNSTSPRDKIATTPSKQSPSSEKTSPRTKLVALNSTLEGDKQPLPSTESLFFSHPNLERISLRDNLIREAPSIGTALAKQWAARQSGTLKQYRGGNMWEDFTFQPFVAKGQKTDTTSMEPHVEGADESTKNSKSKKNGSPRTTTSRSPRSTAKGGLLTSPRRRTTEKEPKQEQHVPGSAAAVPMRWRPNKHKKQKVSHEFESSKKDFYKATAVVGTATTVEPSSTAAPKVAETRADFLAALSHEIPAVLRHLDLRGNSLETLPGEQEFQAHKLFGLMTFQISQNPLQKNALETVGKAMILSQVEADHREMQHAAMMRGVSPEKNGSCLSLPSSSSTLTFLDDSTTSIPAQGLLELELKDCASPSSRRKFATATTCPYAAGQGAAAVSKINRACALGRLSPASSTMMMTRGRQVLDESSSSPSAVAYICHSLIKNRTLVRLDLGGSALTSGRHYNHIETNFPKAGSKSRSRSPFKNAAGATSAASPLVAAGATLVSRPPLAPGLAGAGGSSSSVVAASGSGGLGSPSKSGLNSQGGNIMCSSTTMILRKSGYLNDITDPLNDRNFLGGTSSPSKTKEPKTAAALFGMSSSSSSSSGSGSPGKASKAHHIPSSHSNASSKPTTPAAASTGPGMSRDHSFVSSTLVSRPATVEAPQRPPPGVALASTAGAGSGGKISSHLSDLISGAIMSGGTPTGGSSSSSSSKHVQQLSNSLVYLTPQQCEEVAWADALSSDEDCSFIDSLDDVEHCLGRKHFNNQQNPNAPKPNSSTSSCSKIGTTYIQGRPPPGEKMNINLSFQQHAHIGVSTSALLGSRNMPTSSASASSTAAQNWFLPHSSYMATPNNVSAIAPRVAVLGTSAQEQAGGGTSAALASPSPRTAVSSPCSPSKLPLATTLNNQHRQHYEGNLLEQQLTQLHFNGPEAALFALREALVCNRTLAQLSLRNCRLTSRDIGILCSGLRLNSGTLRELDLSHNIFGQRGARALAYVLVGPKQQQSGDSQEGSGGNAGLPSSSFSTSSSGSGPYPSSSTNGTSCSGLRHLDLSYNPRLGTVRVPSGRQIRPSGGSPTRAGGAAAQLLQHQAHFVSSQMILPPLHFLAEALRSNKKLLGLNLAGCALADAGADQVAKILQVNETLQELGLAQNHIRSVATIADALRYNNETLQRIVLDKNHLGCSGAAELAAALGRVEKGFFLEQVAREQVAREKEKMLIKRTLSTPIRQAQLRHALSTETRPPARTRTQVRR